MSTIGSVYRAITATHTQRMAAAVVSLFHDPSQPIPELFTRVGVFTASTEFIRQNPELFLDVMHEVVVVHAESLVYHDDINFIGFSDHFDVVEPGEVPPIYQVCCTRHPEGIDPSGEPMPAATSFEFIRQGPVQS